MARSISEIYDALILEKEAQPELTALQPEADNAQQFLADLTTSSRVARWRHLLWIVAAAMWVHERLWDAAKAELLAIAASSHIGTLRWYVEKAKQFQYGYDLVIVNNVPGYEVIDPSARIIARAAARENGTIVLLKVAKLVSGVLLPLSEDEELAFLAYMDDMKMAGTTLNVVSLPADLFRITATVYYDPLVMLGDGTLILEPSVKPVEEAVDGYLANVPFDGRYRRSHIHDAMQAATGVVDVVVTNLEARHGLFAYAPVPVYYDAVSGHAVVDPDNLLAATLTYVPYVA
jgi:hypothetical protein